MNDTRKQRVVLAGGAGFLGTALAPVLEQGYEVVVLTRGPDRPVTANTARQVHWDARTSGEWVRELDGAYAIVNLVGRSVNCRKSAANRKEILESRVDSVRALAAGFAQVANPPKVWVQTATAHIFGDTADDLLDESSPIGEGFAPMVGTAWEKAFNEADLPNCRRVLFRISFVLGRHGGALKTLTALTRCFLGGATGSGNQYISWIHIDDVTALFSRALTDDQMQGIYVVTSPNPVSNRVFMRELREAIHRPWSPPVPKPLVYLGAFLMRTDPQLALLGRRCVPTRLLKESHTMMFPHLREALEDLFAASSS